MTKVTRLRKHQNIEYRKKYSGWSLLVPVRRRSVVEGVVADLCLVVEDDGTHGHGVSDEVFADDDEGNASTSNVFLGTGKYRTKLKNKAQLDHPVDN